MDMEKFNACIGHVSEPLLPVPGKSMSINLTGTLRSCESCPVMNGVRKPVRTQSVTRSDKKSGRVFLL